VKGSDCGRELDFAVHASMYGKVQAEPNINPDDQERREEKEKMLVLARAGLSSYLCRLCTMYVNLSVLGVVSTPPQYFQMRCISDFLGRFAKILRHDY